MNLAMPAEGQKAIVDAAGLGEPQKRLDCIVALACQEDDVPTHASPSAIYRLLSARCHVYASDWPSGVTRNDTRAMKPARSRGKMFFQTSCRPVLVSIL